MRRLPKDRQYVDALDNARAFVWLLDRRAPVTVPHFLLEMYAAVYAARRPRLSQRPARTP